jgi:signal transduction histidine kinase
VSRWFPPIAEKLTAGETIIIPDTETMGEAFPDAVEYCRAVGIRSFIMLPLATAKRFLGGLVFSSIHAETPFSDEQVKQLKLVSTFFANALDRQRAARALEESRENARVLAGKLLNTQENERRRLARELHDDLSQRLAVLAISASRTESLLKPLSMDAADKLREMRRQLVKISEDVHAISRQLHPSILEDLGLADAVRSECSAFYRREGIRVDLRSAGIPENLPRAVAFCCFRIIQEGLRNIAKHARTDRAAIDLSGETGRIRLNIADQGRGFDLKNAGKKPGLGLVSMQERVRMIGGELEIITSPGHGTRIRVSAPIPTPGDRQDV